MAGVFGVTVEVLGDAAGAGVAGGSGVAATAAGWAFIFFEEGMRWNFFPLVQGTPSPFGSLLSSPPGYLIWAGLDPGRGPPLAC